MTVCKPYDENTAADFRSLFVARFPDGDAAILDTFLSNPARKTHPSTGSLAYDENGAVKAILGIVPRIVYLGRRQMLAANGVAIAVRKDATRDFFSGFIHDSIMAQGADMYFVNTAIPPSRKRTADALGTVDGPASCAEIRERQLRGTGLAARTVRKVLVRLGVHKTLGELPVADEAVSSDGAWNMVRECKIVARDFDGFWMRYLETNEGLASSRTSEELRWVFAKGMADGETVLMTARKDGELQGYAFCRRTDPSAACWRIADMIALGNDERILERLVCASAAFLRRRTPATCLQVTGFPTWVRPLLARLFPKSSSFGFNKCIWACLNDKAQALCGDWVNAKGGWYGCPYDGDMCLV